METKTVKICAISDIHGHLIDLPECDIVCIAGDLSPMINQDKRGTQCVTWFTNEFTEWVRSLRCKYVVAIAGNHDFLAEAQPDFLRLMLPRLTMFPTELTLWIKKFHYLQDSGVTLEGVKFYGTPWQPPFWDWAFNLPEPRLAEKFANIPSGLDILLSHGPPMGMCDKTTRGEHVGSTALSEAIADKKPKYVVCGHIHEANGKFEAPDSMIYNCSIVNRKYKPTNQPRMIEIEVAT